MNNTVDALKNLYKTLCGQDYAGIPNPTDAEMIDAIAKDAQTGGGGGSSSTGRLIDLTQLELVEGETTVWQYEAGLTVKDFAGAQVYNEDENAGPCLSSLNSIIWATEIAGTGIALIGATVTGTALNPQTFMYFPQTGRFAIVSGGEA